MIDLIKKTMLAGIGAASVSKDKVRETMDEMVGLGKLTAEEAEVMAEKIANTGKDQTEKAKADVSGILSDLLGKANLVTKTEYEALQERVSRLEGLMHKNFPNEDKGL